MSFTQQIIESPSDAAELVRRCHRESKPLVDYGRAHAGLGFPPPAEHVRFCLQGDVIEHYDSDLTLRVSAGATIGRIQDALRPTRQFLALDADDDLTLGEAIAHNMYGPLRLGYGFLRDQLLGLRLIDGRGRDIHAGGRTVKNVAGYDVTRFMTGSLGEMGVIYEATVRTYALPRQVMSVELALDDPATLDPLVPDWLRTDAAPAAMNLEYAESRWRLHVNFFGTTMSCATQLRSLETLLGQTPRFHLMSATEGSFEDYTRQRAVHDAWRRNPAALVKIVVPPAFTCGTCAALAAHWPGMRLDALPAHGRIFAGGAMTADEFVQLNALIDHRSKEFGGFRVLYQRPVGGPDVPPFAPAQPDWPLLEKLKVTMDPHMLLNPGRYLGRDRLNKGAATS